MRSLTPESIRASQANLPPIGSVITKLRRQDPYIQQEQIRYRSPRGFQSWPNHLAYAALIEAGLQVMADWLPVEAHRISGISCVGLGRQPATSPAIPLRRSVSANPRAMT